MAPEDQTDYPGDPDGVALGVALETRALSVFYGQTPAVQEISLTIPRNRVVAFIGPSGCGKSTFLRASTV